MSADDLPKPRSDSVLKTLPEERQHEIAQFSRSHGVIKTAQWLAYNGVVTSKSAVARFLAWYRLRKHLFETTPRQAHLPPNSPGSARS